MEFNGIELILLVVLFPDMFIFPTKVYYFFYLNFSHYLRREVKDVFWGQ